jgi:hypothetical protein
MTKMFRFWAKAESDANPGPAAGIWGDKPKGLWAQRLCEAFLSRARIGAFMAGLYMKHGAPRAWACMRLEAVPCNLSL